MDCIWYLNAMRSIVCIAHEGEHGSPLKFFTFNFQLARGQSHCRDCPLAFGDILIKITYLPEV